MDFGMPALVELASVERTVALCGELGLSFVELNTNFPLQQVHLLDPGLLRELAQRHGIFYTIHLNDEMPVADFNPVVASGYRQAVLEAIDFAGKIGAKVLNMHLSEGARYTMPDRKIFFYDAYREDYLSGMTLFRDVCTDAIGCSGIQICIENSSGFRDFHKDALDCLLESPAFALTLDIGHNHCTGYRDESYILQHRDRLRHMHIHDALGRQDHLPPGEGEIDIDRYLTIGSAQGCTAVLEVKTISGLRRAVNWMKDRAFLP